MNVNEKKPKSIVLIIVSLVITLGLMGYFLFFTGEDNETSGQVHHMQKLTQQVQKMESTVKEKEGELFGLAKAYKEKIGKEMPIGFNPLDLSQETRNLLEQRINEEKDISVKSLLEDILGKNNEIRVLKAEIAEIEKLLPAPHIVEKGENHYQLAVDFLINEKGVEKERAIELVGRAALFDELVAGFKVWNFYDGEEYGTSVTQGEADISPNMLIHIAKKKLTDARDQAVSQRDRLTEDVKTLEEKRDQVITQMELLSTEKESLINTVSDLNRQVNSLYYLLDSQQNLKEKGILKSGFLASTKLRDAAPEHFNQSIDLRTKDQVVISAEDLGIGKIKDVTLYPKFYKKETNYKVEMTADNRYAVLTLLDKTRFKNERVVIAVK